MKVYVFKTSIRQNEVRLVNSILRSIIPHSRWNYDLEDCDKILRIESKTDIVEIVCFNLKIDGIDCKELE